MKQEMKKCPFCAEEILSEATKCKHCGSDLNQNILDTKYGVSQSDYAKYIIIAILLPIVGIIMGAYFMTKPSGKTKKMGESILVWAIMAMILFSALLVYSGGLDYLIVI